MKMKIIIILVIFIVILIFSYSIMNKEEINYSILGDKELFSNNIIYKNFSDLIYDELDKENNFGFYSKDFIFDNARIIDIINDIKDNKSIDGFHIQNMLKRTNILILNVGENEIYYKLSTVNDDENRIFKYLDEVFDDYLLLLDIIKRYNDGKIIVLGYYNNTNDKHNDKYYKYMNNMIYRYCKNHDLLYIDSFEILNNNSDYLTNNTPTYVTNEGNLALFNKIYNKINKLYLHKNY